MAAETCRFDERRASLAGIFEEELLMALERPLN